jgi:hypothetical protein
MAHAIIGTRTLHREGRPTSVWRICVRVATCSLVWCACVVSALSASVTALEYLASHTCACACGMFVHAHVHVHVW